MIHLFRVCLVPLFCGGGAFLAGFLAFHPGWKNATPLTDGSAGSFERAAQKIEEGDLLGNASAKERVRWMLEICRQPSGLTRDHALYEAIQHMQPGDFLQAVADLASIGNELTTMDGEVRGGLIEAAMERWLAVDKNGALRWLALTRAIVESGTIEVRPMGSSDLGAAYGVLAAREPDWMREQVGKLGEKLQRETAIRIMMTAETERDPKKAREWLETFRGSKEWGEAFTAYVTGLAASDPRAAMDLAQSEDAAHLPRGEGDLVTNVFMATARRSPSLAADLLPKFDPKIRQQMFGLGLFFASHGNTDPFEWFAARVSADPALLDLGSNPVENAQMMLSSLVTRDPQRTLDLVTTLPDAQRAVLREGALASWASSRADTFLEWLMTQSPDAFPKDFKSIGTAARREPDRFAGWIATLPAGELRERSQLALVAELARQDRAAEALASFPRTSTVDSFEQTARELASTIGAKDPALAAQWVTSLPPGRAQDDAARGLVTAWAGQTPQATSAWIESLPAGEMRDAATGALAGKLAEADPEAATVWLEQITKPAAREVAVRQIFRSWAHTDPVSSRAWLREFPGVNDVVKARLLRRKR